MSKLNWIFSRVPSQISVFSRKGYTLELHLGRIYIIIIIQHLLISEENIKTNTQKTIFVVSALYYIFKEIIKILQNMHSKLMEM